jgi:Ser/Thr protein kinase RdoA (MazF antagonist)
MLLSGYPEEQRVQLAAILEGYHEFGDFDLRELSLVEPLRTLRMLHYAAWLGRRWDDPAFPHAFPWFNTQAYWERHVLELREQFSLLSEPMWAADLLH